MRHSRSGATVASGMCSRVVEEDAVVDLVRQQQQRVLARDLDDALEHLARVHRARRVVRVDDDDRLGARRDLRADVLEIGLPAVVGVAEVVHRRAAAEARHRRPERVVGRRDEHLVALVEQRLHRHRDELGDAVAEVHVVGVERREAGHLLVPVHDGAPGRHDAPAVAVAVRVRDRLDHVAHDLERRLEAEHRRIAGVELEDRVTLVLQPVGLDECLPADLVENVLELARLVEGAEGTHRFRISAADRGPIDAPTWPADRSVAGARSSRRASTSCASRRRGAGRGSAEPAARPGPSASVRWPKAPRGGSAAGACCGGRRGGSCGSGLTQPRSPPARTCPRSLRTSTSPASFAAEYCRRWPSTGCAPRPLASTCGDLLGAGLALTAHLDLEVVEVADRLLLDLPHHRLEHLVALALVLDQRVALGHGAQADAVLEVVHLVQVVAPAAVEHLQHDAALELARRRLAERLLALLVRDPRVREDLALEARRP